MYIPKATNKYKWVCEVKPNVQGVNADPVLKIYATLPSSLDLYLNLDTNNLPQLLFLEVFKYFLLKHLIFNVLLFFINK